MISLLGQGRSMGSPSQPSAGTDPLIFTIVWDPWGQGPHGATLGRDLGGNLVP